MRWELVFISSSIHKAGNKNSARQKRRCRTLRIRLMVREAGWKLLWTLCTGDAWRSWIECQLPRGKFATLAMQIWGSVGNDS